MERLAICSKVLYDHDILKKNNEIIELKKEINNISTPTVLFESYSSWILTIDKMYENIRNAVEQNINTEYDNMAENGLLLTQTRFFYKIIKNELFLLTGNKVWSKFTSESIVNSIDGFIYSLFNNFAWERIWILGPNVIIDIIFDNIRFQLGGDVSIDKSPCILGDIPIFKCKNCHKKLKFFINKNEKCVYCQ